MLFFVGATSLAACASPVEDDADSTGGSVSEATAATVVDLHVLDIWAQPLETKTVVVKRDGHPITASIEQGDTPETLRAFLGTAPGIYSLDVSAPDHVPLTLTVAFDGANIEVRDASTGPDGGRAGVSVARGRKALRTRTVPGYDLFVGLRHEWFSAQGRPARSGNAVKLLMNGEEAWRNVHDRLLEAHSSVLASTWWWDSTFELVRDDPFLAASYREQNTILAMLEASPAQKRVLVGQFLGSVSLVSWMSSDAGLRKHTNDPSFLFMREGNDSRGRFRFEVPPVSFNERVMTSVAYDPSTVLDPDAPIPSTVPAHDVELTSLVDIASVHQKFTVIDGTTAYIGGMNLRSVDWDTSEHKAFEPRRLEFYATAAEREAAKQGCESCEPTDPGPRKDYMLRIDGPSVVDAIDVFERRWNNLIATRAADAKGRPPMGAIDGDRSPKGDVTVQVTATMPAPYHEYAIAETWFNAVRKAERFIYIEDQYFRMPMLQDALARRMDEKPELKLVVVTKPVTTSDPGCNQTRKSYAFFAERYVDRFAYLTLNTYDPSLGRANAYVPIDVHAKMLVVDDVFMSVGSANKNNRGLVYEHELNAAVLDRNFVTASRHRMLASLAPDVPGTDDENVWFAYIRGVAKENTRRQAANKDPKHAIQAPSGFYYTLDVPSSCTLATVGPDTT